MKKFNSKFIIYFLFLPILLFIRAISKFLLIRFGEIISGRIGHFACCMELYLCEKDHKINIPDRKFIDLFIMGKDISNKQVETFLRRKFIILPRFLLGPLININKIITGGEKHNFFYKKNSNEYKNFFSHRDVNNLLDHSNNHFEFTEDEKNKAKKKCDQIGIDLSKKIVTINLRDNYYFKKYYSERNWDYWDVKNCDINDYELAIKDLLKFGYQIVRIGKGSQKKLEIDNSNYFDLTNHQLRTDLLELFLVEKSSFLIGCNSGGTYAALYLFKKPTYISNVLPLGVAYTSSNKILTNFKSVICAKTNKQLSLSEIYDRGIFFYEFTEKYEKENLIFQKLDPKIIQKSVLELMLRSENKWVVSKEEQRLKNKFLKVYMDILKKHDEIYHGKINCHFGYDYLKANDKYII